MPLVPSGVKIFWPSTNGTIPGDFTRDTNYDDQFIKGTATSVEPGNTGGGAHTHTSPVHSHTIASHNHNAPLPASTSPQTGDRNGSDEVDFSAQAHTHAETLPAQTASAANKQATWVNDSTLPSFIRVIVITSNGSPTGVPDGAWMLWNDSAETPTGWSEPAGPKNRYLRGAAAAGDGGGTGGGGTHSHTADTHFHDIPNHLHASGASAASTPNNDDTNTGGPDIPISHTHTVTSTAPALDDTDAVASGATGTGSNDPPFQKLSAIQNDNGTPKFVLGMVGLWEGTLASIPTDWYLCDGQVGPKLTTPDMRDDFIQGANGIADIGTTGGSLGHDHTDPSTHTHTGSHRHAFTTGGGSAGSPGASGASNPGREATHTHAGNSDKDGPTTGTGIATVDTNSDTQPNFRTVAYIQFQGDVSSAGIGPLIY